MIRRSVEQSVSTDPETVDDVTFDATKTTITGSFLIQPGENRYGIEVLNGSNVVIKRKGYFTGSTPGETEEDTPVEATLTGLTAGTPYDVVVYAGDENLADV